MVLPAHLERPAGTQVEVGAGVAEPRAEMLGLGDQRPNPIGSVVATLSAPSDPDGTDKDGHNYGGEVTVRGQRG